MCFFPSLHSLVGTVASESIYIIDSVRVKKTSSFSNNCVWCALSNYRTRKLFRFFGYATVSRSLLFRARGRREKNRKRSKIEADSNGVSGNDRCVRGSISFFVFGENVRRNQFRGSFARNYVSFVFFFSADHRSSYRSVQSFNYIVLYFESRRCCRIETHT